MTPVLGSGRQEEQELGDILGYLLSSRPAYRRPFRGWCVCWGGGGIHGLGYISVILALRRLSQQDYCTLRPSLTTW